MKPKISKEIKNETIKQDCKIKYKDSEKWKNFVDRIQKNPWIREMVLKRNDGLCAYCGLPIKRNLVIYHGTFDHECLTSDTIKIPHKTKSNPTGFRKAPDCEKRQNNNTRL